MQRRGSVEMRRNQFRSQKKPKLKTVNRVGVLCSAIRSGRGTTEERNTNKLSNKEDFANNNNELVCETVNVVVPFAVSSSAKDSQLLGFIRIILNALGRIQTYAR
ncbi:hypothetical protein L596_021004 [Steinernema carpocapsae]|uniref:Uncharacterized protein n=1 Tax=Steinernema carpocapsae TaxID=34508 RepID=A0A4U5MV67_STECR|nr:hypothetical protein L596_021004 [Steinernema carpocapsae]